MTNRPQQFKASRRLLVAAALALAIGVGWYVRARTGIEWDVETARGLIEEMGFWAPGMFIALVTFRLIILVPSQLMLTVGGVCFGLIWGTVYGAIGVTLSGLLAFGLARLLGGDALRGRVSPGLQRVLDVASRRTGALVVAVGTAYPIGPLTGYHVGAGLTHMPLPLYLSALVLGALVRASLHLPRQQDCRAGRPPGLAGLPGPGRPLPAPLAPRGQKPCGRSDEGLASWDRCLTPGLACQRARLFRSPFPPWLTGRRPESRQSPWRHP